MASTIKSGSNNDLYIQTDGVDRIVVDSNGNTSVTGNVGIGTASPTVPLHVTGSGTFIGGIESTTAYAYLGLRDLNSGGSMADPTVGVGAQTNDLAFRSGGTERVRIDANGYVTKPYQPSFAASRDAGHVPAATYIVCNIVRHNIGGHYNSTTGVFTAPVAGRYVISTMFMCNDDSPYANKNYKIQTNGSNYNSAYSSGGPSNVHHAFSWSGVISLSQSDSVSIWNENLTIYGNSTLYSHFSGYLIG
tara:strand:+ start:480 stop:1220 length:741 start_codon:yes stop_codon:yes gene_type:complete